MPDTDGPCGVNLARSEQRGRLPADVAAAHARLASLPAVRHVRAERDWAAERRAAAELAERLRRTRLQNGNNYAPASPEKFGQGAPKRGAKHALAGRTQRQAILEALRDGPMTAAEICARFQMTRVTQRISDLRDMGHVIPCVRVEREGRVVYAYRLDKEKR